MSYLGSFDSSVLSHSGEAGSTSSIFSFSSHINAAGLRGKYYGAKCIIHRPFLHYAPHNFDEKDLTHEIVNRFREYESGHRDFSLEDQPAKDAIRREIRMACLSDAYIMSAMHQCYKIQHNSLRWGVEAEEACGHQHIRDSTRATDSDRQFGNMLMLAATHQSKHLSWLVTKDDLLAVLHRTIKFLNSISPISITLAIDALLLTQIRDTIGLGSKKGTGSHRTVPTLKRG